MKNFKKFMKEANDFKSFRNLREMYEYDAEQAAANIVKSAKKLGASSADTKLLKQFSKGKSFDNKTLDHINSLIQKHTDKRGNVKEDKGEDKSESVWKDSKKFMKEAVRVKKEKYDWGELVVVTDGNSETYPLHPDEQKKIGKLKDGESVSFKDEQGNHVTATRDGKDAYLTHERTNKKTKVKFKDISK